MPTTWRSWLTGILSKDQLWINDYAAFRAIKGSQGILNHGTSGTQELKSRDHEALKSILAGLSEETDFHKFLQFIFFKQ